MADAPTDPRTVAEQLAEWALDAGNDLEETVLEDAKLRLLDTLGVMLIGSREPLARAVSSAGLRIAPGNEATLIGSAVRGSPGAAALVNGTLAHATDFDDTHRPTLVHPSGPVVASALAVAEAERRSGAALLAAIAIGNEAACRLGNVAPMAFHAQGMHPTAMLAPFACALVACRLSSRTVATATHALGIAGSQAAGILESFADGSWVKPLHAGWAAHAGLVAAELANAGFTGPASVFEGRFGLYRSHLPGRSSEFDFEAVVTNLGRDWSFPQNAFKLYPCAHVIHPFVDIALRLREEGITAVDVARMTLPIAGRFLPVVAEPREAKLRPRTPTHARASLPYCVAFAMLHGRLDPSSFADDAIGDRDVAALADRIVPVPDDEPVPESGFRGAVVLTLSDGGTLASERISDAVSATDLTRKFRANAAPVIGEAAADDLAATVLALEGERDLDRLTTLCRPEPSRWHAA